MTSLILLVLARFSPEIPTSEILYQFKYFKLRLYYIDETCDDSLVTEFQNKSFCPLFHHINLSLNREKVSIPKFY